MAVVDADKECMKLDKIYDFMLKNCVADLIHILLVRNSLKENKELVMYTNMHKKIKWSDYEHVYIKVEKRTYYCASVYVEYETLYEEIDIDRTNTVCVYVTGSQPELENPKEWENLSIKISLFNFINYTKVFPESLRNIMNFLQPRWHGIMEKISKALENKSYANIDINEVNEEYKQLWKEETLEKLSIEDYFVVLKFMKDRIFTITNEMRSKNYS